MSRHPQCVCIMKKKSKYPNYEDLDNEGSPGSHLKLYDCDNCWATISEDIERHSFKKELNWYCICGAKDPTRKY